MWSAWAWAWACVCLQDANVVELAKVGDDHFQLNVKDILSPFQSIGVALASIVAEK